MARTKTAPTPTTDTPSAPPDPPTQDVARPSPVLAWPAEWPVPELPVEKRRRSRGLPMAPVLAGAGNGTTMLTTAAYSAGGPAAAVAAGVVVAAGATAAVLRRRAAVRRSVAARTSSATSGGRTRGGSALRGGSAGGAMRGGGGGRRGAGSGRSGAGSATRSGSGRSGSGLLSGGSRSGKGGSRGGLLGKGSGRHTGPGRGSGGGLGGGKDSGRRQKRAAEKAASKAGKKAAEKALKQAAKKAAKNAGKNAGTSGKSHALKAATGRAARAAWNAARPHTKRVREAAPRQARRAGGALRDGLCALTAGAWTWLRRGRHAAVDRLKAVWARRRHGRTNPDTPDTPAVADTVRRPHTTPTSTGGTRMSGGGHHFVAPAMELARAAANYHPTGMLQVGADFAGLEEALRLHAEAMKVTVENADASLPLDPNIIEIMRHIHGLQLKAAELATELGPAFRKLHDVDITRLENPRKGVAGERMWDVSANL